MPNEDAALLSAAELLDAYRARALSPVEVTQAVLDRIDDIDPKLHAYLAVDRAGALEAARRAERAWLQPGEKPLLCGVPVSIKDLIFTTWLPTTLGSLAFKDYRHPHNSITVDRMLAAGAVIVGKTNTPEFGLLDITRNRLGDDTRNAWSLDHTAGGSSGGAGAAVAAALAPLALGTDGAGSIRIPAFYNGIFGLKPTFGRVPHDGWRGAPYTSHQGPMTRTVRDAALVMQAVSGPHERDPLCLQEAPPDFFDALDGRPLHGAKVALSVDFGYLEPDPEIAQAVRDAADHLRDLGCELIEAHPPRSEATDLDFTSTSPEEFAAAQELIPDFAQHSEKLTNYGMRVMEAGASREGWKYREVVRRREAWAAAARRWFRDYDFLLSPVMGRTVPRWDAERRYDKDNPWPGLFLPIMNACGSPAASVPFGFHSNGLPLAVQIAGRFGDDVGVLRVCAAIEAARPWADRWPTIAREPAALAEA